MKRYDFYVLAMALGVWLAGLGLAAAHPLDDLCGMDRWACARRFTPPVDVDQPADSDAVEFAEATGPAGEVSDAGRGGGDAPQFSWLSSGEEIPSEQDPEPRSREAGATVGASPSSQAQSSAPSLVQSRPSPDRPLAQTIALYLQLGFLHILPKGLDHILFVLALFLASTRLRPLLIQITAFTIAHTITLALAASGVVNAPAGIVEPLIALSIAFVAIENIFFEEMTRWRPFVVFGFGLFHGLGFAGVLAELGLPQNQFAAALVSFNVGVEAGQLTIVGLALIPSLLLRRLLQKESAERLYRPIAVVPASLCIAIIAVWWTVERVFLGG